MNPARMRWLLGAALALCAAPLARAQEGWQAVPQLPAPAIASTSPAAALGRPLASIGRPVATPPGAPRPEVAPPAALPLAPFDLTVAAARAAQARRFVRASGHGTDGPAPWPPPDPVTPTANSGTSEYGPTEPTARVSYGIPEPTTPAAADLSGQGESRPAQAPSPPPPKPTPMPEEEESAPHTMFGAPESAPPPGGDGPGFAPPDVMPGANTGSSVGPSFWEKCVNAVTWGDRNSTAPGPWCSDACMPMLVSPVSRPFYAEDPRSLTELRPIFMYQGIPNNGGPFSGGNAWFFGTQARVAFTDRFSVVLHELGFVGVNPNNDIPGYSGGTGLAEIKIGPKYTFLKNPQTGTIAAAGLMFEFPVGGSDVFQDTGSFSITPYVTFGQTFGRLPGGYGSFNFIGTLGYSASINDQRSSFLYSNLHLDWNVGGLNTFFPLLELNWFHYTGYGDSINANTEGADLFNLGSSTRAGADVVSLAAGLRYRLSDHIMFGGAVEFPFTNEKGLADYRVTLDVIFRY